MDHADHVHVTAAGAESPHQVHTRARAVEAIRGWRAGRVHADTVSTAVGNHADALGLTARRHRSTLLGHLSGMAGLAPDEHERLADQLDGAAPASPPESTATAAAPAILGTVKEI